MSTTLHPVTSQPAVLFVSGGDPRVCTKRVIM